jgi:iron complex outermembrane receptor protein
LLYHLSDLRGYIPSSLGETDFKEDPAQADGNWEAARGYEDQFDQLAGLTFTTENSSFTNHSSLFLRLNDHYEPRPFNILADETNGLGIRSRFLGDWKAASARWEIGGEWYMDDISISTRDNNYRDFPGSGSVEGDLLSSMQQRRNRLQFFQKTTFDLWDDLQLQGGVLYSHTRYKQEQNFPDSERSERNFGSLFTPAVNALYKPDSKTNVTAGVSRGFNFPDVEETLNPEGQINPEIGPATGWNYEIGLNRLWLKNRLQSGITAYWMNVKNLLVAQRVGADQYVGKNAGNSIHRGVEMNMAYQSATNLTISYRAWVAAEFNFHYFRDFVNEGKDFTGNELTGVPDRKLTGGLWLEHESGWYVNGNVLEVGSIPLNDGNSLYSDSYLRINTGIGWKGDFSERLIFNTQFGVQNVLDNSYAASVLINALAFGGGEPRYYYPGMPRNLYGTVKLTYQFK